jgi:putative transposase
MGEPNVLVTPHSLYLQLAESAEQRYRAYRALFRGALEEVAVEAIREATNKAWVPGDDRFRLEIEDLLLRQSAPKPRGGDRKSAKFQERRKINRV